MLHVVHMFPFVPKQVDDLWRAIGLLVQTSIRNTVSQLELEQVSSQ